MLFLAELMVSERPDSASEEERSPQPLLHPAAGREGTGGSPRQLVLVRAAGLPGAGCHGGLGTSLGLKKNVVVSSASNGGDCVGGTQTRKA